MKLACKQGAMELIGHEAIVQTRYRDTRNIWTIGVGHTKAAGDPDPAAYDRGVCLSRRSSNSFRRTCRTTPTM